MIDDEIALRDDMVMIDRDLVTEVVRERRDDLLPTFPALRTSQIVLATRGVIHHVLGHEFIDGGEIVSDNATKQFLDDVLRFPARHPSILPVQRSSGEYRSAVLRCLTAEALLGGGDDDAVRSYVF